MALSKIEIMWSCFPFFLRTNWRSLLSVVRSTLGHPPKHFLEWELFLNPDCSNSSQCRCLLSVVQLATKSLRLRKLPVTFSDSPPLPASLCFFLIAVSLVCFPSESNCLARNFRKSLFFASLMSDWVRCLLFQPFIIICCFWCSLCSDSRLFNLCYF